MSKELEILEDIVNDLVFHSKEHDLEGVEFTLEDAMRVDFLTKNGHSKEESLSIVLNDIRECLDQGLEDADMEMTIEL